MDVSIKLEALALVIIVIIGMFHHDKDNRHIKRYKLFSMCLMLTGATLISDMISCLLIDDVASYSVWKHMVVHSAYFACINSCLSMIAAYVFFLLFEFMPGQKCYKIAKTLIISMWSILMILIPINLWTGCYFYISNNEYCRGPLNKLGFLVLIIEVGMLCMCYFRNRKVVTPYAIQLVKAIPPLAIMMTIAQMCFPDIVFTGIIAVCVNMVLFACFQTNRIGRDALTELQNRQRFFEHLGKYKEKEQSVHIILIHLKNFGQVNKQFGMKGGDAFLYYVSRYLENQNQDYKVYRYGNTHIALLKEFSTFRAAEVTVDAIVQRFDEEWNFGNLSWRQKIQLVHMKCDPAEIDENINAEQLLYMLTFNKDKEENTKFFFSEDVKRAFVRRSYVLQEVRRAIEKESFELYFQPIYSCKEGKFLSAEVLLRLFGEDGSFVSPGEFIPIAEEYNLSDDVTWVVLRKSMRFLEKYPDLPFETISVNMSFNQLNEEYLLDKIKIAQDRFGSLLRKLRIEITEDVITHDPEVASQLMTKINNDGAGFYLDDFGVGFSNFSRMLEFPFEIVKLDRSLMTRIENGSRDYNILKSLISMLHSAGFKVVAEGLETESQVKKAMEIGADKIQGFYYARPMCENDLISFLEEHK